MAGFNANVILKRKFEATEQSYTCRLLALLASLFVKK